MLHIQTSVVNNPSFIELQAHTLKYFVKGDYTFTVYNDAKSFPDYSNFNDTTLRRQISDICSKLNIPCIPINNDRHTFIHSYARRCADAMNHMLYNQLPTTDKYFVIDSDMFPIMPFETTRYDAYDMAFCPSNRTNNGKSIDYIWNGYVYMNMATISPKDKLDWRDEDIEGVWTDVGGGMYYYLKETQNKLYSVPFLSSTHWTALEWPLDIDTRWLNYIRKDNRNIGNKMFAELFDNTLFHFRAGGNWEKNSLETYQTRVMPLVKLVYDVCRN